MMDVPKQVQDKLAQFQNLQNQLQMIAVQKQQLMLQGMDSENALKEMEGFGDGKIYRMVGSIILETKKDECVKKLSDDKESSQAKISVLEKQEKKMASKLNEMRVEIQAMLGGREQPPKTREQ
ncbi:MAG TPA: prefoldin subunit beta [Candidatus Altiarchaeales archaeon]|nr:prefoldin subunit beta [Candidatus Altiarchaeales archaeon]